MTPPDPKVAVQEGKVAIRERNFGAAIQLLRRAYRAEPNPDNALWLATAYGEAGYTQLASLYREIGGIKDPNKNTTGSHRIPKELTTGSHRILQPTVPPPVQDPIPPEPLSPVEKEGSENEQLGNKHFENKHLEIPEPPSSPPLSPQPTPPKLADPVLPAHVKWEYKPTPIDPNTLSTAPPVKPRPVKPEPDPYLPVQHVGDLINPQQGTVLTRRLNQLHRQFKDKPTAELAVQLAEAYDEQENYKEAQRYYREVLDLDLNWILQPMVKERLEEIRQLLNPSEILRPTVHRLLELADGYREMGVADMAEELYRQILRTDADLSLHNAARKGLIKLYPDGKA